MNLVNKPLSRRQFIGISTATTLSLLSSGYALSTKRQDGANNGEFIFIEAEGFANHEL